MSEPVRHKCPEWDEMWISPGDPEFEACLCFTPEEKRLKAGEEPTEDAMTLLERDLFWME